MTVAGFGCSASDPTPGGTAGSHSAAAGAGSVAGSPAIGGQAQTAGAPAGGSPGTSGSPGAGGSVAGSGTAGSATGGSTSGGSTSGGSSSGGSAAGGSAAGGRAGGGSATGGSATGGATGSSGAGGAQSTGTCTASKNTGKSVSGTGPHKVIVETNSANGIKCGTIFRPADLGGTEKYPIFVWGEGGCSQDGLSNQAAMAEIASWGYFIVADGTPGAAGACQGGQNGAAFLDYITWAIAENSKPCSAYYQSLVPTKIAADGFSCGGLMAENAGNDPRFTAVGFSSSGQMGASAAFYDKIHTPYKIMNGGSSDIAYENGLKDYEQISSRKIPIVYFSKSSAGHGGDLGQARGDFNRVNLAWLNWQLKDDLGATGKGFLFGSTCQFCTASGWVYKTANFQ